MGETQLPAIKPELFERLIDRLGLAMQAARTSVLFRDQPPAVAAVHAATTPQATAATGCPAASAIV